MAHERYLRVISGLCDDSAQKKRQVPIATRSLSRSHADLDVDLENTSLSLSSTCIITDLRQNRSLLNMYSPSPAFPPPSVRRTKTSLMPPPRA